LTGLGLVGCGGSGDGEAGQVVAAVLPMPGATVMQRLVEELR
jgi:hypothetical protein